MNIGIVGTAEELKRWEGLRLTRRWTRAQMVREIVSQVLHDQPTAGVVLVDADHRVRLEHHRDALSGGSLIAEAGRQGAVAETPEIPEGGAAEAGPPDSSPEHPARQLLDRIDTDFTYHPPPNEETVESYAQIRASGRALARMYAHLAPSSRELHLALTKLEESVMWVNAAIARHGLLEEQEVGR